MQSYRNTNIFHKEALESAPLNIPEGLRRNARWMGTRLERRPDGKLNKPPYRVRRGLPVVQGQKNNPAHYASFEEALEALESGAVDAIGYVFTKGDLFTIIDIDGAIDLTTGEISPVAAELLREFATYWEVSISGRGLHGICSARKPGPRCTAKREGIELYPGEGARFMVLTGRVLPGTGAASIKPCQREVSKLYEKLFGLASGRGASPPERELVGPADVHEILKKARNSRTGKKFVKLFDHGDRSGYSSPNEADFALINILIFWCSGDASLVEALFRASALYRPPPQKSRGYVGLSVRTALASYTGGFYQPKRLREKSTPERRDALDPYAALLLDPSRWRGQKAGGAYKAYAALILLAAEHGIETDAAELRVGADIRRLAEVAGISRETLSKSSLPHLYRDLKLIKWKKGRGSKAGEFILPKPDLPSDFTTKESTQGRAFSGEVYGDALAALSKFIRMRSGCSKTGRIVELGKMQHVARLGMVAMFCMVALLTAPRGLSLDELVERTGRRKDHLRGVMGKLVKAGICGERGRDCYVFAPDLWDAYARELKRSGIEAAERRSAKSTVRNAKSTSAS